MADQVVFTRAGLAHGARLALPIAATSFAFGMVFGVLARQASLSTIESLLMSALVFAGSAQIIAVGLWATPLPVVTIILTTLIVNLRYLLQGAALRPWLSKVSPAKAYGSLFLLADENWAFTMREFARGGRDAAFLLGGGLTIFVAWTSSTVLGGLLGNLISDPAQWGLDFAFVAVFTALLIGLWRGKADLLPWTTAAIVAVIAYKLLGGQWYIVLGGLAGSIVGAWRDGNQT